MNRRTFMQTSGAAIAGMATAPASTGQHLITARPAWTLCTITYNVLACRGYVGEHSRRDQLLKRMRPQIPQRTALELKLYEPDIVTFQESPAEHVVTTIAQEMDMRCAYFPGGFPGTLITRYDIIEHTNRPDAGQEIARDLFTRHWGKARLETDFGELVLYTAHLYPSSDPATRLREIPEMIRVMRDDLDAGRSLILQGDLNLGPDSAEYQLLLDAGLCDSFAAKDGDAGLTFSSTDPRWRIDYVLTHGPISEHARSCRPLYEGAFRTHPDDPTSVALSDHIPVLAVFSG